MGADLKSATGLNGKILASGQIPTAAATTIYTVPASSAVKVGTFSLSNVTTAPVVIDCGILPSGGAADGTHTNLHQYSLAAGDVISTEDVLSFAKGALLDAGATIVVHPFTATAINYLVTGSVQA